MKKAILIIIVIAAAVWAAWHFIGKKALYPDAAAPAPQAQGSGMPVESAVVTATALNTNLSAVGNLMGNESAKIKAEVSGRIERIHFIEGQSVDEGDVLVELDDELASADVGRAEANYHLAEATYNRLKDLVEIGAVASQELDEATAQMKETQAALHYARTRLSKSKITAPFSGIAGLRSVSIGDYVKEGEMVTEIVSIDPIKLEFSAPEKYLRVLELNQKISLQVDGIPGRIFDGDIYAIDPSLDADTRNIRLKAIVYNKDEALKPGMFGRVQIITAEKPDALMVVEEAVVPTATKPFVYKIVDGKAVQTEVMTGQRQDGMVEIISGLQEGDEIVTAGVIKIQNGAPVMSMNRPAATPPPQAAPTAAPAAEEKIKEELPDNPFEEKDKTDVSPTIVDPIFGKGEEKDNKTQ